MGKIKKRRSRAVGGIASQHEAHLAEDVVGTENDTVSSKRIKERYYQEESGIVDSKLTKKILNAARKQQETLERSNVGGIPTNTSKLGSSQDDSEDDDYHDEHVVYNTADAQFMEELEINEEDAASLQVFMNANPQPRKTLADIIMEKINEKKTDVSTLMPDLEDPLPDLDPKIKEVYQEIRTILQSYRSGKLPKAFKVIPHLKNWEDILYITEPESWSAAAMYQATRIFASNMNQHMAQRFYYLVLLPRIRDDIDYYKRLNFHLFMAIKKSLFKPAAFFKGILIPLCEEGTCTLKEAVIIGGILAKCTIPVLHASAAMLKIAEMKYSGANSIFLRIMISKKYALPYRVIDALVFHFLSFRTEERELPVLWHQCFLTFAETYRRDISSEQKESLLELLKVKTHSKITPEIRRQLQGADTRDVEMDEPILNEDLFQ